METIVNFMTTMHGPSNEGCEAWRRVLNIFIFWNSGFFPTALEQITADAALPATPTLFYAEYQACPGKKYMREEVPRSKDAANPDPSPMERVCMARPLLQGFPFLECFAVRIFILYQVTSS